MQTLDDYQTIVERSHDPAWWVANVLGAEPWSKQAEILRALATHNKVSVASCHGMGKSWLAARGVLWFLYTHNPAVVITTAPTDRQVYGILWKEIRAAHGRAAFTLGGKPLTKRLELDEDWYAWGFTAPDYDPDRFQGFHEENILVVVDEASGVSAPIFEGIEGILSSANARLLLIGNPTNPSSYFAKTHAAGSSFERFSISAYDTPNLTAFGITEADIADGSWEAKITGDLPYPSLVTPEWVADKHKNWRPGSAFYESRVLGRFPREGTDTMIPLAWIEAAQIRELDPGPQDELGLDVAREGNDETACYHRRGGHVRLAFSTRQTRTTETTGRTLAYCREHGVHRVKVDVVGLGAGVFDALDESPEVEAVAVGFGEAASDTERFANLKAELYWRVRERFELGDIDIDPDDEELAAQAHSVKWKLDSKGRVAIETKADAKKRGGKSPDRFEAMVYAFADQGEIHQLDIGMSTRSRPWQV